MLGSAILEVVIGLSFTFLLFALVVTQLNELLVSQRLRRDCFEKALRKVFGDGTGAEALIKEMLATAQDESGTGRLTSNVEDEDFASFILSKIDSLNKQRKHMPPFQTLYKKVVDAKDLAQALALVRQFIHRYDSTEQAREIAQATDRVVLQNSFETLRSFNDQMPKSVIEVEIGAISDRCETILLELLARDGIQTDAGALVPIPDRVKSIADEAGNEFGGSISAFTKEIKSYYNAVMAVATEQFKSRIGRWTFWIGLAIVAVLNVDTLEIGRDLYRDSIDRSNLTAAAAVTVKANSVEQANPAQNIKEPGLNLGWSRFNSDDADAGFILFKLFGLGISLLAITLGAPFWFDTLKRLVNVKSSLPDQGQTDNDRSSTKPASPTPTVVVNYGDSQPKTKPQQ